MFDKEIKESQELMRDIKRILSSMLELWKKELMDGESEDEEYIE